MLILCHEEIFYFSLDLPTSSMAVWKPSKPTDENAAQNQRQSQNSQGTASSAAVQGSGQEAVPQSDQLQMLDLHSHSPLISYQNRLYTAEWTSSIGTDLHFCAPSSPDSLSTIRETPSWALVSASAARLVATPATLAPRNVFQRRAQVELESTAMTVMAEDTARGPSAIPVGPGAQPARLRQARFLERLMGAKRARGEQDEVTVYARRVNTGTGWRAQERRKEQAGEPMRAASEDNDHEHPSDRGDEAVESRTAVRRGRPRGRPRGRGLTRDRNKRLGTQTLFRDYIACGDGDGDGDELGAGGSPAMGMGMMDGSTPASWAGFARRSRDSTVLMDVDALQTELDDDDGSDLAIPDEEE